MKSSHSHRGRQAGACPTGFAITLLLIAACADIKKPAYLERPQPVTSHPVFPPIKARSEASLLEIQFEADEILKIGMAAADVKTLLESRGFVYFTTIINARSAEHFFGYGSVSDPVLIVETTQGKRGVATVSRWEAVK